jgi:hypothetical protein
VSKPPRNNYVLVVFDSCRNDTFVAARPKNIKRLGSIERRWSYAFWTAPASSGGAAAGWTDRIHITFSVAVGHPIGVAFGY